MDDRDRSTTKVGVALEIKEGQVAQELRLLGEEIERVNDLTNRLIEILQPTLGPEYPMAEDGNAMKEPMESSALSQELKAKRNRLAFIGRAVENTMERIEL